MKDPQIWQAIAAVIGAYAALFAGIYAVVTKPIVSRLESMDRRLERIETLLAAHDQRITRLEERTSPLRH